MAECKIEGCSRPVRAREMCATHWGRWKRHGDPAVGIAAYDAGTPSNEERFWTKVSKSASCWLWIGAKSSAGYGQIRLNSRTAFAHRLSYAWANGLADDLGITSGMEVCHRCDVPLCVRPDHLFLGSHQENIADASHKSRVGGNGGQFGESIGNSVLTEQDVLLIRASCDSSSSLAKRFNVSIWTIYQVRKRETWRHLP